MIRRWLKEAVSYVRDPYGVPEDVSRSIREEIEFHLAEEARSRINEGVPPQEACMAAVQRFGDVESAVRECHHVAAAGPARWHRVHLAVTAVAMAVIGGLGALAWSLSRERPVGDGDITGRVVDEESRPVVNAHVLAVVKTWPQQAFRQLAYVAVTKSDGTFEIKDIYPTDQKYEVQIAVVADGRQLESSYVNLREGRLEPINFKLAPAAPPVTVTFRSIGGQPLEGVEVFPHERVQADGGRHMVYFCSGGPVVRRSDSLGRVALPYFAAGDAAAVYLRLPGGEWARRSFKVGDEKEVVVTVAEEVANHSGAL